MLLHSRLPDPPARRDVSPVEPEYVTVTSSDGTELQAWSNRATGPVVLLCNGLGTNPWCWPALLDPECGVHVISWNHRGTGGSQRPLDGSRAGIDAFVEDALAVLDHFDVDACPVMGWSMGVNTAFELAFLHPERVTGLFAVGGVPGGTFSSMLAPLRVPRFVRSAVTVNIARALALMGKPLSVIAGALPMGRVSVTMLTHSGFMLPTPDPQNTGRAVKEFLSTPVDWYMRMAVETSRHVRVSLSRIDVPTAFVAGTYDVLASARDMRTAADRIAGASYVELGGSHFLPLEKPDEVHRHLLELIRRVAEPA